MNGNQLMLTREKRKSKVANITGQYCLNKTTSTTITSPPMPSKKTKKSRPGLDGAAIAYKEDLGMQGIKTSVGNKDKNKFLTILERPLANDEEQRRLQRVARFGAKHKKRKTAAEPLDLDLALSSSSSRATGGEKLVGKKNKAEAKKLVGTSTDLEKPFLRLTTYAKPENVRPLPVLTKALAHIKSRYIKTEDFAWANEQLKSVRQDVTVQQIRNKFVLEIYETHARILLEHGDLDEFHQCQAMIRSLTTGSSSYDLGGGDDDDNNNNNNTSQVHENEFLEETYEFLTHLHQTEEASDEFRAYGLLYALVQSSWGDLTSALSHARNIVEGSSSSSSCEEGDDRPEIIRGSSFRHALRVVKAVLHNDYQAFFRLYECAPHLSPYLMDFLVRRVRSAAYERIIAAYRPTLSVEHFREALFFQDLQETRQFLRKSGALFIQEQGVPPFWVDCRATSVAATKKQRK